MSNESNDLGAFLAGFVIGGLVGAATAIILAPQSGEEMRAQIAERGSDLAHKSTEQYQHAREAASQYTHEYANRASEMVHSTQEQARIVLSRGKEEASSNGNSNQAEAQTGADEADSNEGSEA